MKPRKIAMADFPASTTRPRLQTAACVSALLVVNVFVCRELFVTEYSVHMSSIEGAYIGLSRWISEHPWELSWFPLWYGGVPFQNTYPPLLHVLVAGFAGLTGLSPASAHHAVTAAMYCLGPVTLFLLAKTLSGERLWSFSAALVYSVLSPSAILNPAIATDLGTRWGPWRLQALVAYGEGPHITAMTLLPLAVLALHTALSRRRPAPVYLAALALAAVALTNWIGTFALAVAVFSYLLAYIDRRRIAVSVAAGGIALLAYALASPWIPPSTIAIVASNAQHIVGSFPFGVIQVVYISLLVVAAVVLRVLLKRAGCPQWLQASALFLLFTSTLTLSWAIGDIYLVPQPSRYHLELEMVLVPVLVIGVAGLARRLPQQVRVVGLAVCLLLAAFQVANYRRYARWLIQPGEIESTVEYQTARWLEENLPGTRVFAAGSTQIWLNVFSDSPQLGGGFQPGIVNRQIPALTFGVPFTEDDGESVAKWLRALGVEAVVVGGLRSRDAYRDYRDPDKFRDVFPELWRDGDDTIYAVPGSSQSLAHVISERQVVDRAPIYAVDIEPLEAYDRALRESRLSAADLQWRSPHQIDVTAEFEPSQLLSVQVSYHRGWRASVAGETRPIRSDGLGMMVIAPECDGTCTVELTYDGGIEMRLAQLASGLSVLGGIAWLTVSRLRGRRRDSSLVEKEAAVPAG